MTTYLLPVPTFDDVPELETTTQVMGGAGGPANTPLQALTNRTQFLYVWQQSVAGLTGAGLSGYDQSGATTYPDNTVGTALNTLFGDLKTLNGVSNQISIVPDGTDPTVLDVGFPTTCIAPGSFMAAGQLSGNGTPTNDDAAAGQIGEFMSLDNTTAPATPVSNTTATALSQTLGPGDWMVELQVQVSGTATGINFAGGSISLNSSIDSNYMGNWLGRAGSLPFTQTIAVRKRRVKVAAGNTQVVNANVVGNWTGGSMTFTVFMDITRRR